jgi:hypothetical protein
MATAAMERDMAAARGGAGSAGSGGGGRGGRRSVVSRGRAIARMSTISADCGLALHCHLFCWMSQCAGALPGSRAASAPSRPAILKSTHPLSSITITASQEFYDDAFDSEFGKMSVEDSRMRPFGSGGRPPGAPPAGGRGRRGGKGRGGAAAAAAAAAAASSAAADAAARRRSETGAAGPHCLAAVQSRRGPDVSPVRSF